MKWFEYIIIAIAIMLVILPFLLNKINRKKNKGSCCNCSLCPVKCCCEKNKNEKTNNS